MVKNTEKLSMTIISELGCEEFCAKEIKERFDIINYKINSSCVSFDSNLTDLAKICYKSQSAKRILLTLVSGNFDGTLNNLKEKVDSDLPVELTKEMLSKQSVKLICERHGEHEFSSVDADKIIGFLIEEKISNESKVDLKNPELYLFLNIIDNYFVLGIDVSGRDLSKRQYRVFTHPHTIKGTIAFSLLMFSGLKKESRASDPFSLSGEIPIEAALYQSEKSVNYFEKNFSFQKMKCFEGINFEKIFDEEDKCIIPSEAQQRIFYLDASFKNVSAAKKNAKIAGIDKYLSFSRTDPHAVDLKLETADIIATRIIEPSKNISENAVKKIYAALFTHMGEVLGNKGTFNCVVRNPDFVEAETEKYGFKQTKKAQVYQGKQRFFFLQLKKT